MAACPKLDRSMRKGYGRGTRDIEETEDTIDNISHGTPLWREHYG